MYHPCIIHASSTCAAIVLLPWLLMLGAMQVRAAQVVPAVSTASIDTDRWLEIDLYWFRQSDIDGSTKEFWDRFQPLFAGVRGDRGAILNIGWTVSAVMEWSGNLNQAISLPTGSGQSRWVDESTPLTGTTTQRQQQARARFAASALQQRRGYDPWTYGDVKLLTAALKREAARRGMAGFKVGMLNLAWAGAYGEQGAWVRRHPEAFTTPAPASPGHYWLPPGGYFDPGAQLHADVTSLGGLLHGIAEGMTVHQAYAAQWGSLSRSLGLDAIMLRDSFGTPIPYRRWGPWGAVAPSPDLIRQATEAVAALVKETKLANPDALVMMYSNGASAVGDWRSNGLDLEAIAKQGYLDIWVDQTWAGAWNEIGVRDSSGSFWNSPTKGWTYQLAYMLIHGAMLANTKVRHYPLVETFDAWEDWDIIHSAPERLRWGIWAYSHAAVKTPHGLKMPAGSYISWANQGERLLSEKDVRFLADNINAAVADAHRTTDVLGPTLVYAREAMQWQADHASPGHDVNEWIDEQAGSLIKWPVPILSATRIEWIPQIRSDLFVMQTPSHLSPPLLASLQQLMNHGQPIAIFGSAEGIDPALLSVAGLRAGAASEREQVRLCAATNQAPELIKNVPAAFNTYCHPEDGLSSASARVIYTTEDSPRLTLYLARGARVAVWNPPDLSSIESKPLSQIWGNAGAPYALAAGVLSELLKQQGSLRAQQIDLEQTMNIAAWRVNDGTIRILAGNLEEGLRDDADLSRHTTLVLPDWRLNATWKDAWTGRGFSAAGNLLHIDLNQAKSVLIESPK